MQSIGKSICVAAILLLFFVQAMTPEHQYVRLNSLPKQGKKPLESVHCFNATEFPPP
jgi:hypothetical protein